MKPRFLALALVLCGAVGCIDAALILHSLRAEEAGEANDPDADSFAEEAAAFRALSLRDGRGQIRRDGLVRAHEHVRAMRAEARRRKAARDQRVVGDAAAPFTTAGTAQANTAAAAASSLNWEWMGPGNVGGRIRALLIDPRNASSMLAGSAGGGLWKTSDAGASWAVVDDFLTSLAVSSLVRDPVQLDVLYAGTGEGFFNADAINGAGIFKSTDNGLTWTQLPATAGAAFTAVNRLAISPDGRVLLAATQSGIFRSTDSGASFTQAQAPDLTHVHDVNFDPFDSTRAVAGRGLDGMAWYSRDAGASWTRSAGLPETQGTFGRVEIAYAPSVRDMVYASVNVTQGVLYQSLDGGATYLRAGSISGYLDAQGFYDHALWVNPRNSSDVVLGGVKLWRTTDGGATMQRLTTDNQIASDVVHVDFHTVVETPGFDNAGNTRLLVTNDGGVYELDHLPQSAADPTTWRSLNHNLGVTQFYAAAGNPQTGVIIGGTQDTRSLRFRPEDGPQLWRQVLPGDGGFAAIDSDDPTTMYVEQPRLQIFRLNRAGGGGITSGLPDAGVRANFVAPFVLDPNLQRRMYAGGRNLWRSENVATAPSPQWSQVSTNNQNISAIAVAEGNPDIVWFADFNAIFRTADATAAAPAWTRITGVPQFSRLVTRISIDPTDANTVYVCLGGFSPDNLYKSIDGGATWTDITGAGTSGLPDAPVRDLEIDPIDPSSIWAATEVGIFHSTDGGTTWELPQDGPANVSVEELFIMGRRLVAATHGRGIFAVDLSSAPVAVVSPAALTFTDRQVGVVSAAQAVTISNTGSAPMTVSASVTGQNAGDFQIAGNTCGAGVPAGSQCQLSVTFRPSAAGARAAAVSILTNTQNPGHQVALSGNGVAAPPPDGSAPVAWINPVRVSIDAIGIAKASGCSTCPDAGALSQQSVTGDTGYAEFHPIAGGRMFAGLGADATAATTSANIDYAFSFWPEGTWEVREKGVYRADGFFHQGDVFRVAVDAGVVRYLQNGQVVYTSTIAPQLPLRLDLSLYSLGARLEHAVIRAGGGDPPPPPPPPDPDPGGGSAMTWTHATNVSIAGSALTKTGGCSGCADAGAVSQETLSADGSYVEFVPKPGGRFYAGLTSDPSSPTSTSIIDYAFSFWADGTFDIREKGVYRGEGIFQAGDRFRISLDAGKIRFARNDTVVYTSPAAPVLPLTFQASLLTRDSGITSATIQRPQTGPPPVTWINLVNASPSGGTLTKNAGCNGCADAGGISQQVIGGAGGAVAFTPAFGGRLNVGLSKDRTAATSPSAIDYAFNVWPDGSWDIRELGLYRTEGRFAAGDTFRLAVQDGIVRYYVNEMLVYSSGVTAASPLGADVTLFSAAASVAATIQ